jgi:hypothetical protein
LPYPTNSLVVKEVAGGGGWLPRTIVSFVCYDVYDFRAIIITNIGGDIGLFWQYSDGMPAIWVGIRFPEETRDFSLLYSV